MFKTLGMINFFKDIYNIEFKEILTDNGSEFGNGKQTKICENDFCQARRWTKVGFRPARTTTRHGGNQAAKIVCFIIASSQQQEKEKEWTRRRLRNEKAISAEDGKRLQKSPIIL